jgi:hypothetical protein
MRPDCESILEISVKITIKFEINFFLEFIYKFPLDQIDYKIYFKKKETSSLNQFFCVNQKLKLYDGY